jgi:endoglucanase
MRRCERWFAIAACIVAACSCGHTRPSAEVAQRGMAELAQAMTFANTHEDRAMAGALEASARAATGGGPLPPGVVRRAGDHLVDGAGNPVALRGVNLGGAFLWEAWIWGGELALLRLDNQSEHHIRTALASLVGDAAVDAFARGVYERMADDADFAAIAAHGFNAVRVPLNHRMLERPDGLAVLDRVLALAEAHAIYVVLDLHAAPGGQSRYFVADPDDKRLWDDPSARDRTVALWRALAARYRGRTVVAGYDLLNEPAPPNGAALTDVYARIIAAIREVDPDHLIVLEGGDAARDFSMFTAPLDPNQIFSFHIYTWFGNDAAKRVARYAAFARATGVPMWCGEFGENTVDAVREQVALFDTSGVVGWAFWTWKKVKNRYPALHEIVATPSWRATVDWVVAP